MQSGKSKNLIIQYIQIVMAEAAGTNKRSLQQAIGRLEGDQEQTDLDPDQLQDLQLAVCPWGRWGAA